MFDGVWNLEDYVKYSNEESREEGREEGRAEGLALGEVRQAVKSAITAASLMNNNSTEFIVTLIQKSLDCSYEEAISLYEEYKQLSKF